MGSRNGLNILQKRKNSTACSESNLITFSHSNYNSSGEDLPYKRPPNTNVIYRDRNTDRERERERQRERERRERVRGK